MNRIINVTSGPCITILSTGKDGYIFQGISRLFNYWEIPLQKHKLVAWMQHMYQTLPSPSPPSFPEPVGTFFLWWEYSLWAKDLGQIYQKLKPFILTKKELKRMPPRMLLNQAALSPVGFRITISASLLMMNILLDISSGSFPMLSANVKLILHLLLGMVHCMCNLMQLEMPHWFLELLLSVNCFPAPLLLEIWSLP